MAAKKEKKNWIPVPGMLAFGTATVVTQKLLFSMQGVANSSGELKKFSKPWFQTNSMFFGMLGCLLIYYYKGKSAADKAAKDLEQQPLVNKTAGSSKSKGASYHTLQPPQIGEVEKPASMTKTFFLILIPAIFDLIATLLCNVGLQWIAGSIWQMLRGAMVVFSAILSILFLQRKLYLYNWVGITAVMAALAMVGVACVHQTAPVSGQASSSYQLFGIILVVLAQLVQASQIVTEEFLLKSVKADPFLIVGLEGFWGLILTSFIFLPIFQNVQVEGFSEDSVESLYMLFHSWHLMGTVLFYMFVIMGLNVTAMMVTQQFTAVHRTILEAARTLCIWITNLIIYYAINPVYGELWTAWSYLELGGFLVLLVGLFVYNQVVELPCLPDADQVKQALHEEAEIQEEIQALEQAGATPMGYTPGGRTRRRSLPLPPSSPYMRSPRI